MATKNVFDCVTGLTQEVEMTGAELAAFNAQQAIPAPIVYGGQVSAEWHVQTVGTAPAELIRFSLTPLTVYGALVEVYGIDAANGVVKALTCRQTFKRLTNGPSGVGARTDLASHQDSGAAALTAGVVNWAITPSISGNDAVISVNGAAGRTVDWFAFTTIRRFRPGGAA